MKLNLHKYNEILCTNLSHNHMNDILHFSMNNENIFLYYYGT